MLYEMRFREGVQNGSVTITYRRWKRLQVTPGKRYRTAVGMLEVESVDVIPASKITNADAKRSGYPSAQAVIADLRGTDDLPIYRIRFHAVHEPDPRDELAHSVPTGEEVAAIGVRLDRLDKASKIGPWTTQTLAIIAEHPARRAGDLADLLGRDRLPFKLDVRKLKNLGLTLSLEVGYRLSPRGLEYLRRSVR